MINMLGEKIKLVYKEERSEHPRAIRGKLVSIGEFVVVELPDGKPFLVSKGAVIAIKPVQGKDEMIGEDMNGGNY